MKFIKPLNIDFKDKRTSQQLILVIVGGLGFFILYVNLLFKPTMAGLSEVSPKEQKLRGKITMVQKWMKGKPEAEKQLAALHEKMISYETILSSEEEIPSLLEELSAMAKESGVRIIGIRPQAAIVPGGEAGTDSYEEIPVSIKAKCGYHQLGRFISRLESAKRLLVIEQINIASNPRTSRSHDVQLLVSTFLVAAEEE
jgi:type IV pilus assembly protein PilO